VLAVNTLQKMKEQRLFRKRGERERERERESVRCDLTP
jgi:hypothetical protein